MNICLVEDDWLYAEEISHEITSEIPGVGVRRFHTEKSFNTAVDELEASPPLLFILDVMIRWADLADDEGEEDSPSPEAGFQEAGIRILKRIKDSSTLRDVPVVIYSALSREELGLDKLPPATLFRQKGGDLSHLIRPLRSFLAAQKGLPKDALKKAKAAGDAVKLAPEFMGMSIDLKKLWEVIRRG